MATSSSSSSVSTVCSRFHRAIELIGGRWTGAIVQTLLQGRTRYAAVKAAIPDITDRMLSERLRSLEIEGLVTRVVIPETPVRVEYDLTSNGHELESSLHELAKWAERWIPLETKTDTPVTQSHPSKSHQRRHPTKAASR
jgi:DNA-binding HxlR family transcriptional regulator